ncbi:unnamed protein product [Symbiodinium sp. CCMP2592]|nr:unnamed protein product [Symbiodinium sp. CCMP2592]
MEPGEVSPKSEVRLSREEKQVHILIVGNGMASHWASLWLFEDGNVYSVELSAIDLDTGSRWGRCRCKMRHLAGGDPGSPAAATSFPPSSLSPLIPLHPSPLLPPSSCPEEASEGHEEHDAKVRKTIRKAIEHIWRGPAPRDIEEPIAKFVRNSGSRHYIMTPEPIGLEEATSPELLWNRALACPLHGGFYDLFFHNCQLFLLQLICVQYQVPVDNLPATVGSVAAAPVLLLMEAAFIAIFIALRQEGQSIAAACFATVWLTFESLLTWRYESAVTVVEDWFGPFWLTKLACYGTTAVLLFVLTPWYVFPWVSFLLWMCMAYSMYNEVNAPVEYKQRCVWFRGNPVLPACIITFVFACLQPSDLIQVFPIITLIWDLALVWAALRANLAQNLGNCLCILLAVLTVFDLQRGVGIPAQVALFSLLPLLTCGVGAGLICWYLYELVTSF